MRHSITLGAFVLATTLTATTTLAAHAVSIDQKSLPKKWFVTDLSNDPGITAAAPGARLSLSFPGAPGKPPAAVVFVFRTKKLPTPWPDSAAAWSARLVGQKNVVGELRTVGGRRTYRVEYASDSTVGTQLHTALLATEVTKGDQIKLVIFRYEDVVEAFDDGLPAVRKLFDVVTPLDAG